MEVGTVLAELAESVLGGVSIRRAIDNVNSTNMDPVGVLGCLVDEVEGLRPIFAQCEDGPLSMNSS